jgi:Carboxypeptidase regulatory-like domain
MSKCLLFAASLLVLGSLAGSAQTQTESNPGHAPSVFMGGPKEKKSKVPTSREVHGTVVDQAGRPMEGALVTLTNKSTKDKITFITKKDGHYNFDDLSFTIDYELDAKYKEFASEPYKLSQYDHRADAVRMLEVASNTPAPDAKK